MVWVQYCHRSFIHVEYSYTAASVSFYRPGFQSGDQWTQIRCKNTKYMSARRHIYLKSQCVIGTIWYSMSLIQSPSICPWEKIPKICPQARRENVSNNVNLVLLAVYTCTYILGDKEGLFTYLRFSNKWTTSPFYQ